MRTRAYGFVLWAAMAIVVLPATAVRMQGAPSSAKLAASAHFLAASPGPYVERSVVVPRPRLPTKSSPAGRRRLGSTIDLASTSAGILSSREIDWREQPDGRLTGYFRVQAKGALGLRVRLSVNARTPAFEARFRAPGSDDADHFALKSRDVEQGGAWSPLVAGDTLEAEVVIPSGTPLRRDMFTVSQVSALTTPLRPAAKSIGSAGSCERDVKCYSLSTDAINNAKATALIFITNSSGTFGCSGTLLNTTTNGGVPYFLTSSGCVTSAAEAASINTYWDYEATACGSNTAQAFTKTTGGATLVARDTARHYSLLQLNDAPPGGAWFSGWDAHAPSAGIPVAAVHHPQGDLKKLSQGSVATAGAPLQVQFTSGVTEDGSVGSGIFGDDTYLLGVLYGGASSCSNPSGLDTYWPLSDMWSGLQPYLQPSSTAVAANYSDIWWNPGESGWGLTIADHETQIFAVWYTYRQDGSPTWFVIPGGTLGADHRTFSGTVYQTTGPAYDGPFDPNAVTTSAVGSASIDFAPAGFAAGTALFTYNVNGASRTVQIQRQSYGNAPPNWSSDFTDIWWNPSESGWGLTLAQHGNNVFGVWFTYDTQGRPLFVVMPGVTFSTGTSFAGDLYTTTGPYYGNAVFDASQVRVTKVGSASVGFSSASGFLNANKHATFVPTVNGYTQTKSITGQSFGHASPSSTTPATHRLSVSTSGSGHGNVVSQPAGIACGSGGACAADFAAGATVTLTASAASGSRFVAFTGTCSSSSSTCTLTLSADASVDAQFDALPPPSDLAISVLQLPDATAGQAYDQLAATASGGSPPYHYQSDTFANGTPPPGLVVALNGHVQGTPSTTITSRQAYSFGICVVDLAGTSRCAQAALTVAPAAQNGVMSWSIGDQCNDGMAVDYKFYDRAHNLVWPSATTYYFVTYGQSNVVSKLACTAGAQVCVGAKTSDGSLFWGVGFDGSQGCTSCCATCDGRTYQFGFGCNTSPPPGGAGQCTGLLGGPQACQACNSDADCGGNVCWTGGPPVPFCGG